MTTLDHGVPWWQILATLAHVADERQRWRQRVYGVIRDVQEVRDLLRRGDVDEALSVLRDLALTLDLMAAHGRLADPPF